jgi:phospholipid/cholesterol/gamma-HCH transport system ATP-binding protein
MILLENIHKSFRDNHVLQGVNLEIHDGETVAIIGKSGCGKSVLLKIIIGLLKPDEGHVVVDNVVLDELPRKDLQKFRSKFGMVFQSSALLDSMNVGGNVGLALHELTDKTEDEIYARVHECLGMVGLGGAEPMMPAELSGGMKKRVGFARAIAMNPKYVLYDEPTTGLDPVMSDIITRLIYKFKVNLKITSIVVTHDMKTINQVADRVAMLEDGVIIFDGKPDQVQQSRDVRVHQFVLGNSEIKLAE